MGAWQQADPAVDQVPYTFPPALASTAGKAPAKAPAKATAKANKGKKAKAPFVAHKAMRSQPNPQPKSTVGQQPAPVVTAAAGVEAQLPAGKAKVVGPSAAEYTQALYEDL